ncbi:hypothetical protein AZE42_10273 [Rhizopogon vesiculosus]|uniref:Uncharacterized protein n=1 Tax=Rhizopogon vesiculosus TaxID=180088 RepID=A0A1J8PUM4_9AGAM|nr:hypothetical protein AZE42_10273 [Rhizopogon vesiculosus]
MSMEKSSQVPGGKPVKECIRTISVTSLLIWVADGRLANGDLQPLYFPECHEKAGWFKGMAQLLIEMRVFYRSTGT